MTKLLARSITVALSLAAGLAVTAAPATAHEGRATGAVRFVVGWGDEPAYTGFRNSAQVTVTEASGGAPVTDIGDTLKVEVIKGTEKVTLPLARAGASGDYRAWLTPTRPGAYTFRVHGTVRGQTVNESFSSSPTTFNDVEDSSTIQFPAKDPTPGQLATRVDREFPRIDTALNDAEDTAARAQTMAFAGVAAGALGLLVGAAALVLARRRPEDRGDRSTVAVGRAATDQSESLHR
jgi:hypothetical protein